MFQGGNTFVFGETPSATKWDQVWRNDDALQDWSAFTNATFPEALIAAGGLSAERLDADAIGHGFVEIGRTTLGVASDTISVASLPLRKYLMVLLMLEATGGTVDLTWRFNNDTATNYAQRVSTNNSADATSVSNTAAGAGGGTFTAPMFARILIVNVETVEKITMFHWVNRSTAGAGNAPSRGEGVQKWANTSAQINRIDIVNASGTGDYAIGSEAVVYGKD